MKAIKKNLKDYFHSSQFYNGPWLAFVSQFYPLHNRDCNIVSVHTCMLKQTEPYSPLEGFSVPVWLLSQLAHFYRRRNVLGCLWTPAPSSERICITKERRLSFLSSFAFATATYCSSCTSGFQMSSSHNSQTLVGLFPSCPCRWAPRT